MSVFLALPTVMEKIFEAFSVIIVVLLCYFCPTSMVSNFHDEIIYYERPSPARAGWCGIRNESKCQICFISKLFFLMKTQTHTMLMWMNGWNGSWLKMADSWLLSPYSQSWIRPWSTRFLHSCGGVVGMDMVGSLNLVCSCHCWPITVQCPQDPTPAQSAWCDIKKNRIYCQNCCIFFTPLTKYTRVNVNEIIPKKIISIRLNFPLYVDHHEWLIGYPVHDV